MSEAYLLLLTTTWVAENSFGRAERGRSTGGAGRHKRWEQEIENRVEGGLVGW